jgi:hypothetical protein
MEPEVWHGTRTNKVTEACTHFRATEISHLRAMWQIGTHILVAARDGDVCVIVLRAHDGLDAVSDEVSGLQAVAHAPHAHGDDVADPNGVEAEGHHVGLMDGLGEAELVRGIALVPHRRDADLRLASASVRPMP